MSFFGELDIESANENPFFKPDGIYVCEIADANIKTSKKENTGFAIDYVILEGPKKGKKIQEWKPVPKLYELKGFDNKEMTGSPDDEIKERAERNMSFLKARFKEFGIPPEDMNIVDKTYLLDKIPALNITIKNNDGNERITKVELNDENVDARADADPFA